MACLLAMREAAVAREDADELAILDSELTAMNWTPPGNDNDA